MTFSSHLFAGLALAALAASAHASATPSHVAVDRPERPDTAAEAANMQTVRNLVLAWVLTLPAAIVLSGGLYVVFRQIF